MRLAWREVDLGRGPIYTSLTEAETAQLQRLSAGRDVLEVGSAHGYSAVAMAKAGACVVAVDPMTGPASVPGSLEALERNLRTYDIATRVRVHRSPSRKTLPDYADASFDLVLIDGDHSAEAVEHDILQALRLVRPAGHVAVHDYGEDTCPDVRPACDRLLPGGTLTDTLWVVQR